LDIHGERGHVVVSQFENPDTAQRTAQRWQTGKEYTNNINNNSNRGHYIWQEEDSPGPSSISGNTGTILSNDLYTKLKALLYQTAGNPARYCEIEMVVARPLQEPSPLYMVKQDHEGQIFMRRLMKKIQVLADDRELHKHIVLDGGTFFVSDSFFMYSVFLLNFCTHFANPYPFTSNPDLFSLQHLKCTRTHPHTDPINHKLNWIPFWAAVVCLYLDTLRSCRTVVDSIYIQFPSTPAVLAHPHRMQEVKIAYNVIFRHLKHLVEVHPAITSIHCIPPRILSISEYHHPPVGNYDDLFKLADAEHKTAIQEAAHRGAVDIRTAMLLGWHARAGEQSLLQLLPREAMAIILDYVAPLRELKFNTNI